MKISVFSENFSKNTSKEAFRVQKFNLCQIEDHFESLKKIHDNLEGNLHFCRRNDHKTRVTISLSSIILEQLRVKKKRITTERLLRSFSYLSTSSNDAYDYFSFVVFRNCLTVWRMKKEIKNCFM